MKSTIILILVALLFLSFGLVVRAHEEWVGTAQWVLGIILLLSLLLAVYAMVMLGIAKIRQKKIQTPSEGTMNKDRLRRVRRATPRLALFARGLREVKGRRGHVDTFLGVLYYFSSPPREGILKTRFY